MTNGNTDEYGDISCPYQSFGEGGLVCTIAEKKGNSCTPRTSPKICANCDVGKIYREVGCDQHTGQTYHLTVMGGIIPTKPKIFCKRKKRDTKFEQCQTCTLVTAETTREIITATAGLLHSEGFDSALDDFEKARKALRECEFDAVIRSSISMMESAMKIAQGRMTNTIEGKTITDLWKSISRLMKLDEIGGTSVSSLGSQLSGVISSLGGIRNSLSDAHGDGDDAPEVPAMLAEFVFISSCGLVTLVIRRFNQLMKLK